MVENMLSVMDGKPYLHRTSLAWNPKLAPCPLGSFGLPLPPVRVILRFWFLVKLHGDKTVKLFCAPDPSEQRQQTQEAWVRVKGFEDPSLWEDFAQGLE